MSALKAQSSPPQLAGDHLLSFITRIEKLEENKTAVTEDIREVYSEAKSMGFDVKVLRKIISLRRMEVEKRRELDELLDLYKAAIGMVD